MPSPNSKRLILNLGLLLIVAALVALVYIRQQQGEETFATLYDASIGDEVKRIAIHNEGKPTVVLENKADSWQVIEPEKFVADKEKVRHLFTLLSENAETSYPIEGKNLAQYGLDQDRLSVAFNQVKLIFGKLNEVSQKRYILKGDKMYLVSETVSGLLESGAAGFRLKESE